MYYVGRVFYDAIGIMENVLVFLLKADLNIFFLVVIVVELSIYSGRSYSKDATFLFVL